MKIELILLGVIVFVLIVDFVLKIFKKKKKNASKEIKKHEEFETKTFKKHTILKWVFISLAVLSLGSIVFYQIVFAPKTYKSAEVTFNNNLAYLKSDMSLLTGEINDSIRKGLFVDGKREGFHKIKYNYSSEKQYDSVYKWNIAKSEYTVENRAEGEFIDNKYIGEWTFYHYYGKVYAKGNFIESKGEKLGISGIPIDGRDGVWRFWYENGQLEQQGNYVNDKEDGLWRFWYENGQLKRQGNFVNGNAEGLWRFWYENGQLSQQGNTVNGNEEGLWRFWYENGQLKQQGNYVNDEMEGLWRFWYENGQLKQQGNFVNGNAEGLWRIWYENGQLEQQGNYVNHKEDGLWRYWYENGERKSNEYY